jgi:hypothetical protein
MSGVDHLKVAGYYQLCHLMNIVGTLLFISILYSSIAGTIQVCIARDKHAIMQPRISSGGKEKGGEIKRKMSPFMP